ncbi:MAG TPA: hypothetical protein VNI61_09870, partial [Gemmatimonadales bacterium]|nr:hypothetical protein [Gemmatimonadales bacterium]
MRGFWLFAHYIGFTLWLGAGMAGMIAGIAAKGFAPAERLAVYRALGNVFRVLVFWGALGAVVSGFALLGPWMGSGDMPGWLAIMLVAGLAGGLVAAFGSVPTAARLARLELDPRGELPERFFALRKRQVLVATISGGLGILALVAGTFLR